MEFVVAGSLVGAVLVFLAGYFVGCKVGVQDGILYTPKIVKYKFPKLPATVVEERELPL